MAADFYAPMTYSPVWLYLGVIILMAMVRVGRGDRAQTRPGRAPREPEPPPGWRMARLKGDYIERINEIVRLADGGGDRRPRARTRSSASPCASSSRRRPGSARRR